MIEFFEALGLMFKDLRDFAKFIINKMPRKIDYDCTFEKEVRNDGYQSLDRYFLQIRNENMSKFKVLNSTSYQYNELHKVVIDTANLNSSQKYCLKLKDLSNGRHYRIIYWLTSYKKPMAE